MGAVAMERRATARVAEMGRAAALCLHSIRLRETKSCLVRGRRSCNGTGGRAAAAGMAASAVATAASSMMSNAHYFEAASNPKMDEIKKLLDSKDNKEKLEGMKRLIAVRLRFFSLPYFRACLRCMRSDPPLSDGVEGP